VRIHVEVTFSIETESGLLGREQLARWTCRRTERSVDPGKTGVLRNTIQYDRRFMREHFLEIDSVASTAKSARGREFPKRP